MAGEVGLPPVGEHRVRARAVVDTHAVPGDLAHEGVEAIAVAARREPRFAVADLGGAHRGIRRVDRGCDRAVDHPRRGMLRFAGGEERDHPDRQPDRQPDKTDKLHRTTIHWRSMSRFTVVMAAPGRLVETCKRHLAVLAVDQVGPLIAAGGINVNGAIGSMNQLVVAGDVLEVGPLPGALAPEPRGLAIVFEDDELVIVDKPAGLHVHPLGVYRHGTLINGLLWHAGARPDHPWAAWRPHPAHRLDRGASGLLAIAKRAAIHDALRMQLASGAMQRRYRATVEGSLACDRGTIDGPLGRDPLDDYRRAIVPGGQPARTHFTVVARAATTTTVELELETGRTHQIRAHLASLGHPIVGDTLYGASPREPALTIELRAIELHLEHRGERRRFAL